MQYDMSFDVNYEGKDYDLGTIYYSLTDGIVMTADTLLGTYQLAGAVEENSDSYVFSDGFAKDLKELLGQQKYITIVSAEDMTGVDLENSSVSGLTDAVFTFYEEVCKGFETGMVKPINGGYAIQADGQEAAQLLIRLLDFIGKNPAQVLDATERYMMAVMDGTGADAAQKAEMQAGFAELKASQQDFVEAAGDLSAMLEEIVKMQSVSMVLDSFRYDAEVKKSGDAFRSTALFDVTHKGKNVAKVTTDSTMKNSAESVVIPRNGIALQELQDKLANLENKYNPVIGAEMTWHSDEEYANLQAIRKKEGNTLFGSDYAYAELLVKNGRAYLPLRTLCDMLGEEVAWERAEKTAYVTQNGKRVAMNGLIQDGSAFVNVRSFEKLGYTVDYTSSEDGARMVTLTK